MEPLNPSLTALAISSEISCFCVKNTHPFIGLSRKTALGRPLLRMGAALHSAPSKQLARCLPTAAVEFKKQRADRQHPRPDRAINTVAHIPLSQVMPLADERGRKRDHLLGTDTAFELVLVVAAHRVSPVLLDPHHAMQHKRAVASAVQRQVILFSGRVSLESVT